MKLESSIWINLKDIIFKIISFYLFLVTNYFRKDDIYAQKEDDKSKKFLDQLQRLKVKISIRISIKYFSTKTLTNN